MSTILQKLSVTAHDFRPSSKFNAPEMKRILVAPLNWGLGHATRCIPIIRALINHNFEPIIASDGEALSLLQREFPQLRSVVLPSYNITYADKAKHFKRKLIKDSPQLLKTIKKEKKETKALIQSLNIDGIISDNRFGVRSNQLPSVFITHQLKVLSGSTTWLSTALHQNIISKFDECWVPDVEAEPNLSGQLGHVQALRIPMKYIGPLSRLKKLNPVQTYKLMVLLSGPEPQRSLLEAQLLKDLEQYPDKCVFVRGKIEDQPIATENKNITIYNFLTSSALEQAINSSDLILSRSGYTTVMDLAKLEKKAFFIPTPGQFEQEYLAKKLQDSGHIPFCTQDDFTLSELERVKTYKGLSAFHHEPDYKELFSLF